MKQSGISPEIYKAITSVVDERMQLLAIGREEFGELKAIVRELSERLVRLEDIVSELTEAQKKTEERLTKIEITVQKLTEAQKKTEEILQALIRSHIELKESHNDLKRQVGGLSHTIGYRLEDEAMKSLPSLLEADFGIKVKGRLKRDFLELPDGKEIEVNIIGRGKRDGKELIIVGEAKSQLGKKDIRTFKKKIDKFLSPVLGKNIFPVIITYSAPPAVLRVAEEEKIKVYFSYVL